MKFTGRSGVVRIGNTATPTVYTDIAQVQSVGPIAASSDEIDRTTLDNLTGYREYGRGMTDPGELALTLVWDPSLSSHADLWALFGSGEVRPFEIEFPVKPEAYVARFSGFLKTHPTAAITPEDALTVEMAIRVSGAIAIAPKSEAGGGEDVIKSITVAAFDTATSNGTVKGGYDLVRMTDGFYTAVWNGSAWDYYFRDQRAYRPVIANFSAINSAAISSFGGALRVTAAANEQMRCAVVNLPAPPYMIKMAYIPLLESGQDVVLAGGIWATATQLVAAGLIGRTANNLYRQLYMAKFNRPNSWVADYSPFPAVTDPWMPNSDVVYEELADDGTNRIVRFGPTPALMQTAKHVVGRTDFMTATQAGVFAHSQTASFGASVVLISFQIG